MAKQLDQADGFDQWDRVASELRACRDAQQKAYGSIDSTTLGRFLAGECNPAEKAAVESALHELPELRALTDLVQDVLVGLEPASVDATPATLPFKRQAPRKRHDGFFQRRGALLAAACLFVAVGLGIPSLAGMSFTAPASSPALGNGFASRGGGGQFAMNSPVFATTAGVRAEEPSDDATALLMASPREAPVRSKIMAAAPIPPSSAAASQVTSLAMNRPTLREAEGNIRAGERAEIQGKPEVAARYYGKADHICQQHQLPPRHDVALRAVVKKADLYNRALNWPSCSVLEGAQDPRDVHLASLRDSLNSKDASRAREEAVPALARALRITPDAEKRREFVRALGKLGPAAGPAVHTLVGRLFHSTDAEERRAILETLREIGPAARPSARALQILVGDAPTVVGPYGKRFTFAPLPPADRDLARALLASFSQQK